MLTYLYAHYLWSVAQCQFECIHNLNGRWFAHQSPHDIHLWHPRRFSSTCKGARASASRKFTWWSPWPSWSTVASLSRQVHHWIHPSIYLSIYPFPSIAPFCKTLAPKAKQVNANKTSICRVYGALACLHTLNDLNNLQAAHGCVTKESGAQPLLNSKYCDRQHLAPTLFGLQTRHVRILEPRA